MSLHAYTRHHTSCQNRTLRPKAKLSIRLPSHFSLCAFWTLTQAGIDVAFPQRLSCANSISSVHAEPGSQPACANCSLRESLPQGPPFTSHCRVSRALIRLAPYHAQCWLQTRRSAQHPCLASGSDCFYPLGTLHPIGNHKLPSFARPSAFFDYGNRLAHSFHRLQPALVRLELSTASRVGTDLAICSSPTQLRVPIGCFKLNLLAKTSF
jgi:hypothetical protein